MGRWRRGPTAQQSATQTRRVSPRSNRVVLLLAAVSLSLVVSGSTKQHSVRGAILDGGQAIRVSEPVVDVRSEIDSDMVTLQPSQAQPGATTWQCGTQKATFSHAKGMADLTVANMSFAMRPVVTASGSKYEALSDPTTSLWERGDSATLVVKGQQYPECVKAGAAPAAFRATGNEPGWRLDIAEGNITLLANYGQTRIVMPTAAPEVSMGARTYSAKDRNHSVTVTVSDQVCNDNMSGMPHPNTVVVVLDGKEMRGCGGDPAALLRGPEWAVESIDGAPVVKGSKPTLLFGADGRVSGNSSCNQFTGGFSLTGENLSMTQPAGTMMMCVADALMKQEAVFLKMLRDVNTFAIEGDALVLTTADGRALRARRAPATLEGVEWVVESINGVPVVEGSKARLLFGADGRLSGNSSCNNIVGGFTVTRQRVSIPKPAGTMMACGDALMNQERRLLEMLPDITEYTIDGNALILTTADGRAIRARRG